MLNSGKHRRFESGLRMAPENGAGILHAGRRRLSSVAAGLIVAFFACNSSVGFANDRGGAWSVVADWPLIAIHAALTPDGRVLTYGSDQNGVQGAGGVYDVWDPAIGLGGDAHLTLPNNTAVDSFCSGQLILPRSGDILTAGGNTVEGANRFDYRDNSLKRIENMQFGRWYGTLTTLADGQVLAQGGIGDSINFGLVSYTPEIYSADEGWRSLPGARSELAYGSNGVENRWWYPRSFVAPDGRVFGLTGSVMYFLDPQGDGAIEIAGEFSGENYGLTSTAVMFAPGRILQVGGGGFGANDDGLTEPVGANAASVIDINSGTPVVTAASPMRYRRHWATSTVLPDGRVLLTGGSRSNNVLQGVANVAEIWDPSTDSWTQGASGFIARLYHSTALLLPDGRVLVASGGAPGPLTNLNAEIYHPPYLYSGEQPVSTRPIINEAPAVLDIGADFQAVVGPNDQIARVTLIKTGSVTHSFNMDQRFIELSFSQTGNGLTIAAPASRTLATPGYYMLFAIDATGTPSKGHILTVNPS